MRVLFIHQNFPAQYRHVALHLAREGGHELIAIAKTSAGSVRGVKRMLYQMDDKPEQSVRGYAGDFANKARYGQAVLEILRSLKQRGFIPDVILAHPGWGEPLFTKDVFPDSPRLDYCEFYYHANGADVNFDPEQAAGSDAAQIRARNLSALSCLESSDWGISPTGWQRSKYPAAFRDRISVIHDGIDTDLVRPDPDVQVTLPNGTVLGRADEVVTYIARNLEPYRGFHQFMRAAGLILKRRPRAQIVVVGGDDVSYGRRPAAGTTYREMMLKQVALDRTRIHFLGKLPYADYLKVLQLSAAHIYLTVPFVLSWSLLESMSAGCLVIGSDTPPVAEAIADGDNGLLVDFFSPEAIADRVDEVLEHPDRHGEIRRRARQTVLDRYALDHCLPQHLALLRDVAAGGPPVPAPAGTPLVLPRNDRRALTPIVSGDDAHAFGFSLGPPLRGVGKAVRD